MTAPSLAIREATGDDLDRVEALLNAADLPRRDVRAKREAFLVAVRDGSIVGAGGIERYGADGLLRSVVVAPPFRDRGYGTALCDELEARARTDGVETLYLLTTTASAFFRRRGYEPIARSEAPARIRETAQFTDLCPASATCMGRRLGDA